MPEQSAGDDARFSVPRLRVVLFLSMLIVACAPGRVGGRPAEAPVVERGAPAADASPTPAPASAAEASGAAKAGPVPAPTPAPPDFESVRPLLEEKCTPCHFPGGRMHESMPFDREDTVRRLGEAMLTRLRDPVDQELLRTFLEKPRD